MPASAPESPPRRKWTFWRFLLSLFLYLWVALLLIMSGLGVVGYVIYDHITQPGTAGPEISVTVPQGATGQQVAQALEEQGLIHHRAFFLWAMKLDETKRPIIQGQYQLARGLSAQELLHQLQEGPEFRREDQFRITVPEGLSLAQAAQLTPNPQAFLDAAADPELIALLGLPVQKLEGFLMPNTYFFDAQPSEREIVQRMLAQFQKEYAQIEKALPIAKRRNKLEVITLASLIEEEAKLEAERPLVAAVLSNRIKKKMPLQMDSTLQYALNKYGQRMLDADKAVDSPYNTYKYPGLPPGPICSPGAASIRAALQPAKEDYLYFVSNADGRTHTFSSTYEEHQRAVARYRQEISVQRKEAAKAETTPPQ